jgi:cytochrome P450
MSTIDIDADTGAARATLLYLLTNHADDRQPLYDTLAVQQPLYRDESGTWMISSYRLAKTVLNSTEFSNRAPSAGSGGLQDTAGILDMMLFQSADHHHRLRQVFAPLFSRARMATLREFVQADLAALFEQIPDPSRFDLVAQVAQRLPVLTICRLLGMDVSDTSRLVSASLSAIRLISFAPLQPHEHMQAVTQTMTFMGELNGYMPGVLSLLRDGNAQSAGQLQHTRPGVEEMNEALEGTTYRELLVNVLLMFIAGYGTTMLSIGNSVCEALRRPGLWRSLVANPVSVPEILRELMRVEPAVHILIRYAVRDVTLDGVSIKAGERVALLIAAANRDPTEFERPDEIRVDRARGNALAFGAGMHGCIGVALARMQLEALFAALIERMPNVTLAAPGRDANPRLQEGCFRGYRELWLAGGCAGQQ